MPLGIVSDSDLMSEINNSSVDSTPSINDSIPTNNSNHRPSELDELDGAVITSDVITMKSVGRHSEVNNIPSSLRKVLGEEAAINGIQSAMQLANSLGGISQPSLSTYARGESSPGKTNTQLLEHINGRKTKISSRALNKLNLAMSLIDEQKLLGCDAKELSSVAKDMAVVAKAMEPTVKEDEKKDPIQFHFYAPQIRNEAHYEVVQAKDNY
jgi:hypothetical protein